MTKDIFKSPDLQYPFREQGYVIVPLLTQQQIQQLAEIYAAYERSSQVQLPFYTSIWSENAEYRESVDAELKRILSSALNKYLLDCKPVFANFMVKHPGDQSQLIPHQDWSFVDETRYDSVTVWCPLVDVNDFNGNLQVVPRSHRLKNLVRGRFFDAPFQNLFDKVIYHRLRSLPMKAGEALILNSRLIHASPPNRSSQVRVTASVVMVPQEAELIHYVLEDTQAKKSFKKLYITPRFFTDYSCYDSL
ncbi:MAG TPA: phytanoyl-CoA dioxygenase family protein, partial [Chitinophagales bacterium]|nr:phytanoyl-CoA dioxygenase family protein [Chitinophagales bacterium]